MSEMLVLQQWGRSKFGIPIPFIYLILLIRTVNWKCKTPISIHFASFIRDALRLRKWGQFEYIEHNRLNLINSLRQFTKVNTKIIYLLNGNVRHNNNTQSGFFFHSIVLYVFKKKFSFEKFIVKSPYITITQRGRGWFWFSL